MADTVAWHRPEYQGRENELISHAQAATASGVSRAAISNWARRHPDFPAPALTVGRQQLIPAAEFDTWLTAHRADTRPKTTGAQRLDRARTAEIQHLQRRIGRLTLRFQRQEATLAATHRDLEAARAELAALQQ